MLLEIQRDLLDRTYRATIFSSISQSEYWPWIRNRVFSAGSDYPGSRDEA